MATTDSTSTTRLRISNSVLAWLILSAAITICRLHLIIKAGLDLMLTTLQLVERARLRKLRMRTIDLVEEASHLIPVL
jgi:hypothetical protein